MGYFQDHPEYIEPFRSGDTRVQERLYTCYRDRLVAYIGKKYKLDRADIMDLLHGTFQIAFESRQRNAYNPERSFFAWLVGIARHEASRSRTQNSRYLHEDIEELPDRSVDVESQDMARDLVARLWETMSETEISVIELHHLKGHTQESTARRMGLDRSKVRRLIRGVRRRLLSMVTSEKTLSRWD